jgi:hypothetical protein
MQPPRKTRVYEWVVCIAILMAGLGILGVYVFASAHGTTPENELTEIEGEPSNVQMSEVFGRYGSRTEFLKFTVAGYQTEYGSNRPHYQEVLNAVQGDEALHIWVSTKQETLFPRQGWVPLYKMRVGDKVILTYNDTVSHEKGGAFAALVVGCVVSAAGAAGVYQCYRQSSKYRRWASSGTEG